METLKVEVSGAVGSGKSAIMQAMIESLRAKGITVHTVSPLELTRSPEELDAIFAKIKENVVVFEEVAAPSIVLRRTQHLVDGEWQDVQVQDLVSGERFRMFEPDGTPVTSGDGTSDWTAYGLPFFSGGVWGIAIDVTERTSSEADTDTWKETASAAVSEFPDAGV